MADQSLLAELLEKHFYLAEPSVDQLHTAFEIRYEVFCKEFGFEREEDCPGGRESDEYDAQSWHCLSWHVGSGMAAGCVRIVHVGGNEPCQQLPMEKHCAGSFSHPELQPALLPRESVCEVSRLAVRSGFRRRLRESETPIGDIDALAFLPDRFRSFPVISVSLFMAATVLVLLREKPNVFAMMEPRLARLLGRVGLRFVQVGEVIDYHGPRAAYYINLADALRGIQASEILLPLYERANKAIRAGGSHGELAS